MVRKLNCWEFKNCGREPGGLMAEVLGPCPVPAAMEFDGSNGGIGAGRVCWLVNGGNCKNGSVRWRRTQSCLECEFYHRVHYEEETAPVTVTTSPV
ncbi:MAG: two-CW domain-containing protein [Candidatus Zixiibacteriota bacterium]